MHAASLSLLLAAALPLAAQLAPPNADGVSMGHVHLNVRDVEEHKAFWTGIMGGKVVRNGPLEMIEFPGVYIMLTKADNPAPPGGSVLNHFGFVVKDMPAALAKWKAANLKVDPTENPNEAFVWAPDEIRIEVYGLPRLAVPIQMNHLHFNTANIPGMQAWYNRAFGAVIGRRACIACVSRPSLTETGDVPGSNLSFSAGAADLVGTKGRAIDHIGFEVTNIEAFVKNLEANGLKMEGPIRQAPNTNLKIAFLTDLWGTYIELTEGLSPQANASSKR